MSQPTCWLIQSGSQLELGNSLTLQNLGQETTAGGGVFWPACGSRRHIGQRVWALLPLFLSVSFRWSERVRKMEWKSWNHTRLLSWSSPSQIYPRTLEPVRPQNRSTTDRLPDIPSAVIKYLCYTCPMASTKWWDLQGHTIGLNNFLPHYVVFWIYKTNLKAPVPGGPVVKTLCFQCTVHRSDP